MNIKELRKLLEPYNPWWKDRRWYKHDPLLQNFYNSMLRSDMETPTLTLSATLRSSANVSAQLQETKT